MKITENGLKLTTGTDGVDNLLFNSKRAKDCLAFAIKHKVRRIKLNPYHDFDDLDLESIVPLKDFLEGLIIGSEKIDLGKLSVFHNLRLLGFSDNKKDAIDLLNFPELEALATDFSKRLVGLETCGKLKRLTLSNYNSKNNDLSDLPALDSLEDLFLIKPNVVTLRGIERLKKLEKLRLFSDSKLEKISPIKALSESLKEIEIEKCKKISDYEILNELTALEKIRLSDSGEIKTLSFLKNLPKLEFISFAGTNVLDGNLAYCEGIVFVGFDNKRHYSHKFEYFKKR